MSPFSTQTLELAVKLSGGNPGAAAVMVCVLGAYQNEPKAAAVLLGLLEALEITGADIWALYKDECGEDIIEFSRAVILRASKHLSFDKL